MKHTLLATAIIFFLFLQNIRSQGGAIECNYIPQVDQVKMWYNEIDHKANFPETKLRVGGILKYKEELYFVNKKLKTVDVYVFDFNDKKWEISKDSTLFHALEYTYKDKYLASGLGAIELVGDTLFLGGVCDYSFCTVDINKKKEVYQTNVDLPDYQGSESSSGVAFDYPNVYIAFHSNDYDKEIAETQRLIGIDTQTDSVIFNSELKGSENRRDSTHGLTSIDGQLWHIKDDALTKMNGENGEIMGTYLIENIKRPTSLCFLNNSLWIITYYGGLYEIPLKCE